MNSQVIQGSILNIGTTEIELGNSIASAIRAINDKTETTGVEAFLDEEGRFVLKAVDTSVTNIAFTLTGTGDFGRVTGLGNYSIGASALGGTVGAKQTTLTGSADVSTTTKISNSKISILAHNQIQTFDISGTLEEVATLLSNSVWDGHNGITAAVVDGKFVIKLNDDGAKELTVNVLSGDFGRVTGLADYLMGGATITPGTAGGAINGEITSLPIGNGSVSVKGGNHITEEDYIVNGSLTIGSYVFETKNRTIISLISEINNANITGIRASIEDGKFTINALNAECTISASGDFARVTGIMSYTPGAAVTEGSKISTDSSATNTIVAGMQNISRITKADALSKGYTIIETASDLINAVSQNGSGTVGKTYILMNDIDMAGINNYVSKTNFGGTFDGNGYSIKNLTVQKGLFETATADSIIKNVNLINIKANYSGDNVGGLAGISNGIIQNCSIDVTSTITGNNAVGGLVGYSSGTIQFCSSDATVRVAISQGGGLVGRGYNVQNSKSGSTVQSFGSAAGGLVGEIFSTIKNSYSTGIVTGSGLSVGGLAGQINSTSGTVTIDTTYSSAKVVGGWAVGGLIGGTPTGTNTDTLSSFTIKDSYAKGSVEATQGGNAGGLIGYANGGTISGSYATGSVTVSGQTGNGYSYQYSTGTNTYGGYVNSAGGLIGYNSNQAVTITDAYTTSSLTMRQQNSYGETYICGLIGYANSATIQNAYASNSITDTMESSYNYTYKSVKGGLIASGGSIKITGSFYNYEKAGLDNGAGSSNVTYGTAMDNNPIANKINNLKKIIAGTTSPSSNGPESSTFVKNITQLTEEEATARGYVIIKTAQDFISAISDNGNLTNGKTYILMNDIYMQGINYTSKSGFAGIFDGNGYKIQGLTKMLFSATSNYAVIKNVGLENVNINNGTSSTIGALIGNASSYTNVINCYATGTVIGGNNTGGLVGYAGTYSYIKDCNAAVNINTSSTYTSNSYNQHGGLVGYLSDNSKIENSHSSGTVYGYKLTGGLVGQMGSNINISDSYSTGNVTGHFGQTGGFIGNTGNSNKITNSYATGDVNTTYQSNTSGTQSLIGGFIGQLGSLNTISNSYATGSVKCQSTNSYNIAGGFIGYVSSENKLYNVYSTGDTYGGMTGGLVGQCSSTNYLYIYNSYTTSKANYAITGNNTAQSTYGVWYKSDKITNSGSSSGYTPVGVSDYSAVSNIKIANNQRLTEAEANAAGYTVIKTASDLVSFLSSTGSTTNGKTYVLMGDIDLSGYTLSTAMSDFNGLLYGNGYTIKNFSSSQGMFNSIGAAGQVKNLTLDNSYIAATTHAGTITNYLYGGTIDHVTVTNGTIGTSASNYIGGLVGNGFGTITYTGFEGTVMGQSNHTGGLIGYANNSSYISNSYTTGSVTSSSGTTGGLIGYAESANYINVTLNSSYSSAAIATTGAKGGLTGKYSNSGNLNIYDSAYLFSTAYGSSSNSYPTSYINSSSSYNAIDNSQLSNDKTFTNIGWSKDIWSFEDGYPSIIAASVLNGGDAANLIPAYLKSGVQVDNADSIKAFKGQKDGVLTINIIGTSNSYSVSIGAADTLTDVINNISSISNLLNASIDADGKIKIIFKGKANGISVEDTSGFADFYGLTTAPKSYDANLSVSYTSTQTISGGNIVESSDKIANGYIKINDLNFSAGGKSMQDVVDDINNEKIKGVRASITNGKFTIVSTDTTISYTASGDFARLTGLSTYTVGSAVLDKLSDSASGALGAYEVTHMSEADALKKGYKVIKTAEDFINNIQTSGASGYFILMGDIDMYSITNYAAKAGFWGTLDGNGYSIKNLTSSSGLFNDICSSGIVKNLKLENFTIQSTSNSTIGALACTITDNTTIQNCSVDKKSNINGRGNVGGLIGYASQSNIINCTSSANVIASANHPAGGLVGYADGGSSYKISNSVATGSVSGQDSTGGLVGYLNVKLTDSFATGSVTGNNYVGGLVGSTNGNNTFDYTISNSDATGNVSAIKGGTAG